jgi:Xaa-Pro aminopeptidase
MAQSGNLPQITVAERDRRHQVVREHLREQDVDCVIVSGSNLFYLTNGLPGERLGVLPSDGRPMTAFINGRHLVDVPASVLEDAQEWVKHVRAAGDAGPIIDLLSELHLDKATIGFGDSPNQISHGLYSQLTAAFPDAKFVDVSTVFTNVRTIKSDEEIEMIAQANRAFDAAVVAVHENARVGMTGAQVVQIGIKAMWDAGGDLHSTFGFTFGSTPKQNPILGNLGLTRPVQAGDIGTMTAHAEFGGYGGHTDQEVSFGTPKELHRQMFDAVLHVRSAVLGSVRAGITQHEILDVYAKACEETGFSGSPHSQIHQYGIDVPEFPGPAFRAEAGEGRRGNNFVLAPGMIYSISPTVVAKDGEDLMLGGTSLAVTEDGYRELTDRKVELLTIS